MRNILRDPGAEVLVGIASFAVSFMAIGLALAATKGIHVLWVIVAFSVAGLFVVISGYCFFILLRHYSKTKRYIQQIGVFLRQGRQMRGELLAVNAPDKWTKDLQEKAPKWEAEVQQWLDDNLPEHALEFDLENSLSTLHLMGILVHAGEAAERLESRMHNLKEILHDIRM